MAEVNFKNRTLYHGDNLEYLRGMNSGTVHLIATDPPFNKNKDFYATPDSLASGARFADRWSWDRDIGGHDDWVDGIKAFMWSMQASSDDLRDCWETLARRGWFPHPSMFIGTNQIAKIADQHPDIVDEVFMNQFRKRLDDIEKELVELYPRRLHLLHDAFDAHRRGQYSLAVLMFLNQADGIWYDEHSNSVFRAQDRIDTYKGQNVPQVIGDILSSYIGLLSRPLPIWLNEVDRGKEFHDFNRHLVTHGVSVDYGTEKNSLQLISFLRWLSSFLESMKTKSKT